MSGHLALSKRLGPRAPTRYGGAHQARPPARDGHPRPGADRLRTLARLVDADPAGWRRRILPGRRRPARALRATRVSDVRRLGGIPGHDRHSGCTDRWPCCRHAVLAGDSGRHAECPLLAAGRDHRRGDHDRAAAGRRVQFSRRGGAGQAHPPARPSRPDPRGRRALDRPDGIGHGAPRRGRDRSTHRDAQPQGADEPRRRADPALRGHRRAGRDDPRRPRPLQGCQ